VIGYRETMRPRWAVLARRQGRLSVVPLPEARDLYEARQRARQLDLEAVEFEVHVDGCVVGRVPAREVTP